MLFKMKFNLMLACASLSLTEKNIKPLVFNFNI